LDRRESLPPRKALLVQPFGMAFNGYPRGFFGFPSRYTSKTKQKRPIVGGGGFSPSQEYESKRASSPNRGNTEKCLKPPSIGTYWFLEISIFSPKKDPLLWSRVNDYLPSIP